MTRKLVVVRLAAIVFVALMSAGQARARILSLDCSDGAGVYDKIWVDFDKSTITQSVVRIGSGFEGAPPVTFPAQITATAIKWTTRGEGAPFWFNVSIDRTTGILTQIGAGVGTGYSTRRCVKGTTPFPATKF
ncbi:MAG TPA: hypothetical protein VMV19_21170 [Xanthobacteraceae bacterium]|nr:hypothetical protein [Xanthobacteraceae bacterium]